MSPVNPPISGMEKIHTAWPFFRASFPAKTSQNFAEVLFLAGSTRHTSPVQKKRSPNWCCKILSVLSGFGSQSQTPEKKFPSFEVFVKRELHARCIWLSTKARDSVPSMNTWIIFHPCYFWMNDFSPSHWHSVFFIARANSSKGFSPPQKKMVGFLIKVETPAIRCHYLDKKTW